MYTVKATNDDQEGDGDGNVQENDRENKDHQDNSNYDQQDDNNSYVYNFMDVNKACDGVYVASYNTGFDIGQAYGNSYVNDHTNGRDAMVVPDNEYDNDWHSDNGYGNFINIQKAKNDNCLCVYCCLLI